jgi:hypothetical protein
VLLVWKSLFHPALAAALITLATSVMAGSLNLPSPPPPAPGEFTFNSPPSVEEKLATEAGKRTSCGIYNIVSDPKWNGNLGPLERAMWCKAQPKAVRHKYGSKPTDEVHAHPWAYADQGTRAPIMVEMAGRLSVAESAPLSGKPLRFQRGVELTCRRTYA